MKVDKEQRIAIIKRLLLETEFSEQNALLKALAENGVETNQTNLSRDLKFLDVSKVNGVYLLPNKKTDVVYQVNAILPCGELFAIIKTKSAHATMIASVIDEWNYPSIIGTIAGDDTILVAFKDSYNASNGFEILQKNFNINPPEIIE